MDFSHLYPDILNANSLAVFVGRVVELDDDYEDNGILYVDITDPTSTDIAAGKQRSYKALSTLSVLTCFKSWNNPPEIAHKSTFTGAMSLTSQGDFHLRNYCFDMQTMAWFTTVSTALNALGIVNIPPVMVGLDTTPFPGTAVSMNLAPAAQECVNDNINSALSSLTAPPAQMPPGNKPDKVEIQRRIAERLSQQTPRTRSLPTPSSAEDVITELVLTITDAIKGFKDSAIAPLVEFVGVIGKLLTLYTNNLARVERFTLPITQFAHIDKQGTAILPNPDDVQGLQVVVLSRIEAINASIDLQLLDVQGKISELIVDAVYAPIQQLFSTITAMLNSLVDPIKKKITENIGAAFKEPLTKLTTLISMTVQPVFAPLPSFIQLLGKMAIKALLDMLIGKPIKYLVQSIVEPIQEILDTIVEDVMAAIGAVVSGAINTLIKPVIGLVQQGFAQIICPVGYVENLNILVDEYIAGTTPLPKITFPDKTQKEFLDIDWSDANDVAALLRAMFGDSSTTTTQYTEKKVSTTMVLRSDGTPYGATLSAPGNSTTYTFRELNAQEFMPLFSLYYFKVVVPAVLGRGIFVTKPQVWTVNYVKYITAGTERYLVGTGDAMLCSDGVYRSTIENRLYKTTTIPHTVPKNSSLAQYIYVAVPTTQEESLGEDLVLLYNGALVPVTVPKLRAGVELYYDGSNERTFQEICTQYFSPERTAPLSFAAVIARDDSLSYNTTTQQWNISISVPQLLLNILQGGTPDTIVRSKANNNIVPNNTITLLQNIQLYTRPGSTNIPYGAGRYAGFTYLGIGVFFVGTTKNTLQLLTAQYTSADPFQPRVWTVIQNDEGEVYLPDLYKISEVFKDYNENKFYLWTETTLVDTVVSTETDIDAVQEKLIAMAAKVIACLGQEGTFDADMLVGSVIKDSMEPLQQIAGKLTDLTSVVSPLLERMGGLKEVETIMDTLSETVEQVQETVEAIEPALNSVAAAVGGVAPQACSMSQAATGTDFSFNTGDAYALKTTTDAKSQLPYCKNLQREKFIEENTTVLLLAVGGGKENLFVIDILN